MPQPIPFLDHPKEHPFFDIVEDFLDSIGIPADHIRTVEPNVVQWTFFAEPKLSIVFSLYKDSKHEVFVNLEVAFGIVSRDFSATSALELLRRNSQHFFPMCYAVTDYGYAVVQFRSYAAGITADHLLIRLNSILQLATEGFRLFVNPNFGLLSLPENWFKKPVNH